jgi:hypothetical protein
VGAAAVERPEAEHELFKLERLGEVLVGAEPEPREVAVHDRDVVGVEVQRLQSGVSVAGDVGSDRLRLVPRVEGGLISR